MPHPTARRRLLTAAVALGTLFTAQAASAQETRKVRLGHSFADSHPRALAMKQFAAAVQKTSGGKIVIEVYGNAVLGSEEKMLLATQSGTQDLYMGSLAPISARRKELQIFDVPFLFGNDAEAAAVLDGSAGRQLLDGLSDLGLQGLVWSGGAFRNMSNSKRALGSLADMKGLKVRVMQSPMALASFNAMGMNAVPMAFTEVYPALEIKALDGYEHPVVDMHANKMYEVQKYLTITNHVYTPVAIVASRRWWSALPADQQAAVRKAAEEIRGVQRTQELKQAAEVITELKAKGMVVQEMPPAELARIRTVVQPVVERNLAALGADFVGGFMGEIQKARAAR
ncbi:MAG: hypothetical protein RL223_2317 [Pseudomonadota bacterium]